MRITILHSDISTNASLDEQETMLQVSAVQQALENLGHEISRLSFTLDFPNLIAQIKIQSPALVFNLVESVQGKTEDVHLAPLLLEQLNIPYTGASASNMMLTTNKLVAKRWLKAGNLPTPAWIEAHEIANLNRVLDSSYIVKSATEEGSVGILQDSVVADDKALQTIISDRTRCYGGAWFAERYIAGREFTAAFLTSGEEINLLPIAEMRFDGLPETIFPIIDYTMKWDNASAVYHAVTRSFELQNESDTEILAIIRETALKCCAWFKMQGYGRIDMRVDEQKNIWILEINTNSSIAPDAGFVAQAEHRGMTYNQLIEHIVNEALV